MIRYLLFFVMAGGIAEALARLTPLAPAPDWKSLEAFQETITREEFQKLLETVYAPQGAWKDVIEIGEAAARILTRADSPPFILRFAPSRDAERPVPRYWRPRAVLPAAPEGKPLHGVKIALDPGHLGGQWAKMEERWLRAGEGPPVQEGDLTLRIAKMLAARLEALGAQAVLTRTKPGPVTPDRPGQLRSAAAASLKDRELPITSKSIQKESERLFYRVSEIRHRAGLVNEKFRPDLVVCLHLNAEDWGNESHPRLVSDNHLHLLITGTWSARELDYEDQRFEMLRKLLGRTLPEELAASEAMAAVMARRTGLPPYTYPSANARRVGSNPYVWARNLLANRLFQCPVIYIEPYVMNNREVIARIHAGDYEGERVVAGRPRPSIFREYADAVAEGLAQHFLKRGEH